MSEYGLFFDFVSANDEINHSGVLSNVLRLDPRYPYRPDQRYEALKALEQYASTSIKAYRAIEWWSLPVETTRYQWLKEMESAATRILQRVEKPKEYLAYSSKQIKVSDGR